MIGITVVGVEGVEPAVTPSGAKWHSIISPVSAAREQSSLLSRAASTPSGADRNISRPINLCRGSGSRTHRHTHPKGACYRYTIPRQRFICYRLRPELYVVRGTPHPDHRNALKIIPHPPGQNGIASFRPFRGTRAKQFARSRAASTPAGACLP